MITFCIIGGAILVVAGVFGAIGWYKRKHPIYITRKL